MMSPIRTTGAACAGRFPLFLMLLVCLHSTSFAQPIQGTPEFSTSRQHLAQNKFDEAITSLQPLLNNPTSAGPAMIEIGTIRMRQAEAEYARALSHFGEAAQNLATGLEQGGLTGPQLPNTLYDLGRLYEERLLEYPKAIEMYQKIMDEHTTFLAIDKVAYQLASCLEKMGQVSEAVSMYQYVLANHPYSSFFQVSQERMKALAPGTKHAAAAIEIQEEIVDSSSGEQQSTQATLDLAAMQAESGKTQQAIKSYRQVAQESNDPDVAREALKRMATLMDEKDKDYKGAAKVLEELVEKYPDSSDNDENLYRLGRIYEQDVQDLKTRIVDGQVRYRKSSSNAVKALEYYDRVTESNPDADVSANAFLRKGEIFEKQLNDPDEAKKQFTEFLRRFPTHPEAENIRQRLKDIDNAD